MRNFTSIFNAAVLAVCMALILRPVQTKAGTGRIPAVKDTTPIEKLDYKLDKQEFMIYYGLDDTSRALIRMFFRKRDMSLVSCFGVPVATLFVSGYFFGESQRAIKDGKGEGAASGPLLLGLVSGLIGCIIVPVDGLVHRLTWTRKKLLYTLINRERGVPIPAKIFTEIKRSEFY